MSETFAVNNININSPFNFIEQLAERQYRTLFEKKCFASLSHVSSFNEQEQWIVFSEQGLQYAVAPFRSLHVERYYEKVFELADLVTRKGLNVQISDSFGRRSPKKAFLMHFYEQSKSPIILDSYYIAICETALRILKKEPNKRTTQLYPTCKKSVTCTVYTEKPLNECDMNFNLKHLVLKTDTMSWKILQIARTQNELYLCIGDTMENNTHIPLGVKLCDLEITAEDFLRLGNGSEITLSAECLKHAVLQFNNETFAEVDIAVENGELLLQVKDIVSFAHRV